VDLNAILKVAARGGASDIILRTGAVPKFRFNGELVPLSDGTIITESIMASWMDKIVPANLRHKLDNLDDLDFTLENQHKNRFRVNLFKQRGVFAMVLRVITQHIRTLEELQLPPIITQLALEKRGLVLVTGATGSGKSTTLAAMIEKINQERAGHIITIEDPIEHHFIDKSSMIHQREIGIDTPSFDIALRSAMRQNPDVIFVGELRDTETVKTALDAAETGHLVLSTLHTTDAVESLTRIMSFFPPHQYQAIATIIASTLRGIISQRLIFSKKRQSMIAANEIMICNSQIASIIASGGNFADIRLAIANGQRSYKMQTFDQSLLQLHAIGAISAEEALHHASSKEDVRLRLSGIAS